MYIRKKITKRKDYTFKTKFYIDFFFYRVDVDDNARPANLANSAVLKLLEEEEQQQRQGGK